MSVMGVINMWRQFFSTLLGIVRSHDFDFDDEIKISFLILCRTFKNVHFGPNFLHWRNILYFIWKFGTYNFIHKIFRETVTRWFYCDVNSDRAGRGILCRMLSMSSIDDDESSEITSAKYFFDFASHIQAKLDQGLSVVRLNDTG